MCPFRLNNNKTIKQSTDSRSALQAGQSTKSAQAETLLMVCIGLKGTRAEWRLNFNTSDEKFSEQVKSREKVTALFHKQYLTVDLHCSVPNMYSWIFLYVWLHSSSVFQTYNDFAGTWKSRMFQLYYVKSLVFPFFPKNSKLLQEEYKFPKMRLATIKD